MRLLTGRYTRLQEQYGEACVTVQQQKLLIIQLEEDLRSVNALSAMFRGDAEVRQSILSVSLKNKRCQCCFSTFMRPAT